MSRRETGMAFQCSFLLEMRTIPMNSYTELSQRIWLVSTVLTLNLKEKTKHAVDAPWKVCLSRFALAVQRTRSKIQRLQWLNATSKVFPLPPLFPDLTSSDYYLFPQLEPNSSDKNFESNEGIIDAVHEYLEDQKKEQRWTNCIEMKDDYIKN